MKHVLKSVAISIALKIFKLMYLDIYISYFLFLDVM